MALTYDEEEALFNQWVKDFNEQLKIVAGEQYFEIPAEDSVCQICFEAGDDPRQAADEFWVAVQNS